MKATSIYRRCGYTENGYGVCDEAPVEDIKATREGSNVIDRFPRCQDHVAATVLRLLANGYDSIEHDRGIYSAPATLAITNRLALV